MNCHWFAGFSLQDLSEGVAQAACREADADGLDLGEPKFLRLLQLRPLGFGGDFVVLELARLAV